MSFTREQLKQALHLPDFDTTAARLPMVPSDRALAPPPAEHRLGAVLALFFPADTGTANNDNDVNVILLKRPSNMRNHPGQIAFPGGRVDEGETFEQTAVRETMEEIGVSADDASFSMVGRIDPIYIPPSRFYIHPFVAWLDQRPEYVPSPAEVETILEVPSAHFLLRENRDRSEQDLGFGKIIVPFFIYGEHKIWGATSALLFELAQRIEQVRIRV